MQKHRTHAASCGVFCENKEWKAYSAGTKPAGYVHLKVTTALNEIGIMHVGKSKHIDELHTKDFDMVVTVCDDAAEECPVWPGKAGKRVHHGFVDPAKAEGNDEDQMAVFRQVRSELKEFIPKILGLDTSREKHAELLDQRR